MESKQTYFPLMKRSGLVTVFLLTVVSLHLVLQQRKMSTLNPNDQYGVQIKVTTTTPPDRNASSSSAPLVLLTAHNSQQVERKRLNNHPLSSVLPTVGAKKKARASWNNTSSILRPWRSTNEANVMVGSTTIDNKNRAPQRNYTQDDIARYILNQPGIRFHVLIFDGAQFHVYRIGTTPSIPLTCYCRQHWHELLIDGLMTARPNRFIAAIKNTHSPSTWQVLMDITRDTILHTCWQKGDNCTADQRDPPVLALSSMPKMAKTQAPLIYQYPLPYYNDCLFHLYRQRVGTRNAATNSSAPTECESLKRDMDQFSNVTDQVWESLIPQVVWRGSSLSFLSSRVQQCTDLLPQKRGNVTLAQIVDLILESRDDITPRCTGVALTIHAESERQQGRCQAQGDLKDATSSLRNCSLPWINIKYGGFPRMHSGYIARGYDMFMGEYMSPLNMARYKYQIDLGGVGGTTWLGTISKLAMPGLLFHHETPTQDWFYDEIEPWVHYVPIHTNLSNLYDMFVWAETHPQEARFIAQQGQDYARKQIRLEHFMATFDKLYVQQLGAIADSYQPTCNSSYPNGPEETLESILQRYQDSGLFPRHMATCNKDACQFFIRKWIHGWRP